MGEQQQQHSQESQQLGHSQLGVKIAKELEKAEERRIKRLNRQTQV